MHKLPHHNVRQLFVGVAENKVAKLVDDQRFGFLDTGFAGVRRVCSSHNSHCDGGVTGGDADFRFSTSSRQVAQHLFDARLAGSKTIDQRLANDNARPGKRWRDRFLEHGFHFAGNTRQRDEPTRVGLVGQR